MQYHQHGLSSRSNAKEQDSRVIHPFCSHELLAEYDQQFAQG